MDPNREKKISKTVSWLLRHGCIKEGIPIRSDAFAKVDDILNYKNMIHMGVIYPELKHIVDSNDKQRFVIQEEISSDGKKELWIKATQGHSMVFDDIGLKKIKDITDIPNVHNIHKISSSYKPR